MLSTRRTRLVGLVALSALTFGTAAGCLGTIGDGGSGAAGAGPGVDPQGASCSPTADPIRRLTPAEYQNTVASLFPGVGLPALVPLPDGRIDGFVGHTDGQSVSALGVQAYEEMAVAISVAAVADLAAWAPCTEDSAACLSELALDLGRRAYRRPLDGEEVTALETLASSSYAEFGMQEASELVVQALLQSPLFLYRPEVGLGAEDGATVAPLDDWEMASRLSYFFLDDMPDGELVAAAEAGELVADEGLELHARRLLDDPRARPVLTGFFAEWLRVYKLDELALDPNAFPEFDETLRADLEASTFLFLDKVLWQDDSWESLMTGSFGFVNDRLAPVFGVAAPGTDELTLVELSASERRGVLTQPGLLASTSHGIQHSPIYRGVTMLSSVLCNEMPAPPPGILDDFEPVDVPADEVCTVRDQIAKTHTVGNDCQGCHAQIDGAGFAFEHYDALGRFRTEENGCEVDASGTFPGTLGDVTDAIDMADKLAASEDAATCMAAHMFRFGLGRSEVRGDQCMIDAMTDAMLGGSGSLREMVVALVLSPAFRTRRVAE